MEITFVHCLLAWLGLGGATWGGCVISDFRDMARGRTPRLITAVNPYATKPTVGDYLLFGMFVSIGGPVSLLVATIGRAFSVEVAPMAQEWQRRSDQRRLRGGTPRPTELAASEEVAGD